MHQRIRETIAQTVAMLFISATLAVAACVTPPVPAPVRPSAGGRSSATPAAPARGTLEDTIFTLTNRARARAGLSPLRYEPHLARAAAIQAMQMAKEGKLAHVLPNEPYPTLQSRLAAAEYAWSEAGENASWNYSGDRAVAGWMNSPLHRENILGDFTEIGIGAAAGTEGHVYYVQVFARPR